MIERIELTKKQKKPVGEFKYIYILYFTILPFLLGYSFFFLYVCHGDINLFIKLFLNFDKAYAGWIIGYEVIASLLLIKLLISTKKDIVKNKKKKK